MQENPIADIRCFRHILVDDAYCSESALTLASQDIGEQCEIHHQDHYLRIRLQKNLPSYPVLQPTRDIRFLIR